MEVAGVVLGAIPLIISAMEYYPKVKELGTQVWKFRRTRQDELRQVAFCKEMLKLHLQALLHLNNAEIEDLLKKPTDEFWKDTDVEQQLKQRLGGSYSQYADELANVERKMIKTMKAAKWEDEGFQKYLASLAVDPVHAADLQMRASAFLKKVAMQPRIGMHALGFAERKELLKELEASIKRLKELLEAVDGVSEANKTQQMAKNYKIPPIMQGFWHRAERIWRLIHEHLRCACRSKHCARLWFDRSSMAQDSLGLVFLFDKAVPRTAEPWKRRRLKIHRSSTQCTCGYHVVPQSGVTPTITVHAAGATTTASPPPAAAPMPTAQSSSISVSGLCEILKHQEKEHVCLGALCSTDDDHPYHFLPNQDTEAYDFVPLSATLDPSARPFFELRPRMKLAAMLASAHLRYYRTPWIPDTWNLANICFPRDLQDASKVQFDMPYILADFSDPSTNKTPMDRGFVTLGIVLLEVCFGRPLEKHDMWSDANLNATDAFHRQYVAGQWAKTIDLMIDGPEYAKAVKWCLTESPTDDKDDKWRDEFAMNVLGPLLKSANLLT